MNIGNKPPDNTKAKPREDETSDKCKEDPAPLHVHHGCKNILNEFIEGDDNDEYSNLHQSFIFTTNSVELGVTIPRLGYYPPPFYLLQILNTLISSVSISIITFMHFKFGMESDLCRVGTTESVS